TFNHCRKIQGPIQRSLRLERLKRGIMMTTINISCLMSIILTDHRIVAHPLLFFH
ncbi:12765_t:CDS:1, partial [Ambispora leptoticha]